MTLATVPATTRSCGGSTFAERPDLEAPDARIIWHADLDPGTLRVIAVPTDRDDPDGVDLASFAPWLSVAVDACGEHAVLSDGWRHIRLDVERGSLSGGSVVLHYQLRGLRSAERRVLPLRRFLDLCRHRRFGVSLYPPDARIDRWLLALRVHDAVAAGASQHDLIRALFGDARGDAGSRQTDSLRSRVRRLIKEAHALANGGYRLLLRKDLRDISDSNG